MIDRREIISLFDKVLLGERFKRSGTVWRLDSDEVVSVLALQKSNYDNSWFINLGFWLRVLDETRQVPKQEHCHVQARAEELWSQRDPSPDELLSESAALSDSDRSREITLFLQSEITPVLQRSTTIESLKKILIEYRGFRVRRVAHEIMEFEV
jgi:hypothetical protein